MAARGSLAKGLLEQGVQASAMGSGASSSASRSWTGSRTSGHFQDLQDPTWYRLIESSYFPHQEAGGKERPYSLRAAKQGAFKGSLIPPIS